MGLLDKFFKNKLSPEPQNLSRFQMIQDMGEGFYSFDGQLFQSDIVRACIRPKSKATGKLLAQHIRDSKDTFQTNPNKNISMLLEEPNPLMTGQVMQEKMANQLELNNNAFALIKRSENYEPIEIYPVPAQSVDVLEGSLGDLYLKFYFNNGTQMVVPYVDVIHLRQDFNENDFFGEDPSEALSQLMDVVNTIDQGVVKAIKNSAVVKWIMKFNQTLKDEDVQMKVDDFTKNYLDVNNSTSGAIPQNGNYELEQVKPQDYVPDSEQMNTTTQRIYNFFNINEKIVQSKYTEDEWNAWYESVIEPLAKQLSGEYTRKIFTKPERKRGNKIIFESSSLQYASMQTKLQLVQMVDRGAMSRNEWRRVMNLPPVKGGDEMIMRLDTAEVSEEGGEQDNEQQNGN